MAKNIIDVKNLSKKFDITTKEPGLKGTKYKDKNKVSELLNPINFLLWLVVSFRDVF